MLHEKQLITLDTDWDETLARITQYLQNKDFRVVCSFNLQMDIPVNIDCPCPRHNSEKCNCSMAFLLVYAPQKTPVSVLVHAHEKKISFFLDASRQRYQDHEVAESIRALLASQGFSNSSKEVFTGAIRESISD